MWNKKIVYTLAAAAVAAVLMSGCTNEKLENELAYREVGINSMENGDYEGAVAAFDRALAQCVGKITRTEMDICYYKAAAQYAGGDLEGALNTYQALLDYDSKDGNAYYLRGCISLQTGDSKSALKDFENAVKYNPNDYELYINIFENLAGYNLSGEGETYLNKAFDIKGDKAENLAFRGKIYYMLGEYQNAIEELNAAIEKESKEAELYLGQVYEAMGDMASAETHYRAYVDSGAADAQAMNALAEIEIGKGNYAGALSYALGGLGMEEVPNKRELMQNAIISYEYTGDFASAWSMMQEYIELYPDDEAAQREAIFLKNRQTEGAAEETDTQQSEGMEGVPSTEDIPSAENVPEGTES